MRIISRGSLVRYYEKHPEAKTALEEWYTKTKESQWSSFADVKNTFNSADNVGSQRYVFNIKGNDFRIVVVIKMLIKTVLIRFIGTYSE